MTQLPNDIPPQPSMELSYQTPQPHQKAKTLLHLVVIFNFIVAGIDMLGALASVGFAVFLTYASTMSTSASSSSEPAIWFMIALYGAIALIGILAGVVKVIAALKIMRRRRHAWAWGLAAAISGMAAIVTCGLLGIFGLAAGIFTLVALLINDAKNYLAQEAAQNASA